MAKHRTHSIEFKRQVVQEFPAGSFEEVQSRIDCPVADGGARRMSLA
jgi:hypothetical protein